jgi:hypothetical protein
MDVKSILGYDAIATMASGADSEDVEDADLVGFRGGGATGVSNTSTAGGASGFHGGGATEMSDTSMAGAAAETKVVGMGSGRGGFGRTLGVVESGRHTGSALECGAHFEKVALGSRRVSHVSEQRRLYLDISSRDWRPC